MEHRLAGGRIPPTCGPAQGRPGGRPTGARRRRLKIIPPPLPTVAPSLRIADAVPGAIVRAILCPARAFMHLLMSQTGQVGAMDNVAGATDDWRHEITRQRGWHEPRGDPQNGDGAPQRRNVPFSPGAHPRPSYRLRERGTRRPSAPVRRGRGGVPAGLPPVRSVPPPAPLPVRRDARRWCRSAGRLPGRRALITCPPVRPLRRVAALPDAVRCAKSIRQHHDRDRAAVIRPPPFPRSRRATGRTAADHPRSKRPAVPDKPKGKERL